MLGREGRSGAEVEVAAEVAGLEAAGLGFEVEVIAVEAAGLPAMGADERAFPGHAHSVQGKGRVAMGKKDRALHAGFPFTASGIGRSHLPAPALSHGFGGDTDAMIALSGLAWEVVIEMGMGEEERWSDDGEWNMGRKEKVKGACGREWRSRGRRLPKWRFRGVEVLNASVGRSDLS